MCNFVMIVGFAMATMVESTMIMKKPIIIAQSAFQGFWECGEFWVRKFQRWVGWAGFGAVRRVPLDDGGVAAVIYPPRFSFRRCPAARSLPGRPARTVTDIQRALLPLTQSRAATDPIRGTPRGRFRVRSVFCGAHVSLVGRHLQERQDAGPTEAVFEPVF
jgi:hypothetical protein